MRLRTKLAALAVTAGVALSATAAYAFWTTAGSGTGSASSAADYANRIVVNQNSVVSGLVPGGTAQTLSGNFTNSNEGSVDVQSVTATVTGTHLGSGAPNSNAACTAADFEVSAISVTSSLISAGQTEGAWSGTIRMLDREGANQNGCKSAVVDLSYSSN